MEDQTLENTMEDPSVPSNPAIPSRIKQEKWIKVYSEKSEGQLKSQTHSNSHSDDSNDEKSEYFREKWLLFNDKEHEDEDKSMTQHDITWQFSSKLRLTTVVRI
ncbi:hypothetical protein TNCT_724711 [Trichonephila clavata]|uniref:Uncharacterized protein n=1 Tax=Trichonephila clavata TaxID=2740835 RepID=A0A8X6HWR6_TRICU|nr:hypothetical protein TNCT_724711 [Trichonephila clavata]